MLVTFVIHKNVIIAVKIKILHISRFHVGFFQFVYGSKSLIEFSAITDTLHLELNEGAAFTGFDMIFLEYAP